MSNIVVFLRQIIYKVLSFNLYFFLNVISFLATQHARSELPNQGWEVGALALEMWHLNHWTTSEVLIKHFR